MLGSKSTKLGNLVSKENVNKMLKRKCRDFCVWERQVKQECRKEEKMRERNKGAMDKHLEKSEEMIETLTNQNATENCNIDHEDNEMMIAVGEEMNRMLGGHGI